MDYGLPWRIISIWMLIEGYFCKDAHEVFFCKDAHGSSHRNPIKIWYGFSKPKPNPKTNFLHGRPYKNNPRFSSRFK